MTTYYTITILNLYHLQNTWASHYNQISNGANTLTILHQMGTNHWAFQNETLKWQILRLSLEHIKHWYVPN